MLTSAWEHTFFSKNTVSLTRRWPTVPAKPSLYMLHAFATLSLQQGTKPMCWKTVTSAHLRHPSIGTFCGNSPVDVLNPQGRC